MMAQKAEILAAFAQTGEVLDEFVTSRSAEERAITGLAGESSGYSARELLALTGFWMRYMVERMAFYARGEEPPRDVDFDALNRAELTAQASHSWDEIVQKTRESLSSLTAAVEQSSEDFLQTPNYYGSYPPGPLQGEILANGFTWALEEIEKYYRRVDEPARAAAIHARLVAVNGEPEVIVCDLMTAEQIHDAEPSLLILDVRDADEYVAGHLPSARNLPLDALAEQIETLPREYTIVTYCNMHHPGQSRGERAAALLAAHGYQVAALSGGYPAWAASYPTETSEQQPVE